MLLTFESLHFKFKEDENLSNQFWNTAWRTAEPLIYANRL